MAALAASAGCDVGEASFQPVDAPSPTLLEIRATSAIGPGGGPQRTPIDPGGSSQVLSTASFILKFDRFLLPSTATRQSVCLYSDLSVEVRSLDECAALPEAARVLLEPTYNPLEREVIYRRRTGDPRLIAGVRYRLAVLAPAGDQDIGGFRAFDGAPLGQTVRLDFSVAAADPPGATDELAPSGELYCRRDPSCLATCGTDDACRQQCEIRGFGVEPYLKSCTFGSSCHAGSRATGAGLSLENGELIQLTAVNRTAHQTQTGERADDPDLVSRRFGRAMPIIDPENPGNSYLLYKMAVGPNAADRSLPSGEAEALARELQRLHASVVVGMPMPPFNVASFYLHDPGDPMLDPASLLPRVDGGDMDVITAWIAQGAPTRDCAAPPYD